MSSEPSHLGWLIKRLQYGHHRALDAKLAPLEVSLVQWNALREIARHPGASQHHLAEQTFNSDQAFGTLLTRLEARGLVRREPGEGRANVLSLTSKGAALLAEGQAVHEEVIRGSFAPLKKSERAELARLLTKLADRTLGIDVSSMEPH